jgi:hypothetical protein
MPKPYHHTIGHMIQQIVTSTITTPMSLYFMRGHIIPPPEWGVKDNHMIEYAVKIIEYPELDVLTDGTIMFPIGLKKYKSSDIIHITGTATILEPNTMYRYVRTECEKLYAKNHYRDRIVATMFSEDMFESYLHHTTYHTKEEYDADPDNFEIVTKPNRKILSDDEDFDVDDPTVSLEFTQDGYRIKNTFESVDQVVKYVRPLENLEIKNVMFNHCFVKSLIIKTLTSCPDPAELVINNHVCASIPFNKKFDLTEPADTKLNVFHTITRKPDIDGLYVSRFNDIRLRFRNPIEDFDLIVEDINMVDRWGNKRYCM